MAHVVVGVVSYHVTLPHHPYHRPSVGVVAVLHLVGVDEESCLHSHLLQSIQNGGCANVWSVVKCQVETFIFNRFRSSGSSRGGGSCGGGSPRRGGSGGGGGSPRGGGSSGGGSSHKGVGGSGGGSSHKGVGGSGGVSSHKGGGGSGGGGSPRG